MELRHYQQEAIDIILEKNRNGIKSMLMVFATGLGKTFTAKQIISHFNRCLWITHTEELIEQSANVLGDELSIGIIKQERIEIDRSIVVASIQTLHRRLDKISPDHFDCIIIDEAHMAMASTWTKTATYFKPNLLLGLTATPKRMDGMSLGNLFDEIAIEKDIRFGIQNKFLCEIDAKRIKTQINLDTVRTTAGELNQKDLRLVDNPRRNELIVQKWVEYAAGRQTLIFCVDVEHAQNLSNCFQRAGISASFLVANESICPDRKARISLFKTKEINIMCNVMILTAGFDYPDVSCIIMARPTKSLTLYMQMIGRGTRLKSDDSNCIVLDIVDSTNRHSLINTWSLDESKEIEEKVFVTTENRDKLIEAREKRKAEILHEIKTDESVNLLKLPKVIVYQGGKNREPATEKQLAWLQREGYDIVNNTFTKGQCSEIINNFAANSGQIWFLKKNGYDISKGVTMGEYQKAKIEIEDRLNISNIEQKYRTRFSGVR